MIFSRQLDATAKQLKELSIEIEEKNEQMDKLAHENVPESICKLLENNEKIATREFFKKMDLN